MKKSFKQFREDMGAGGQAGPPTNNISGGHVALFDPIMSFSNKKKKHVTDIERRKPPVK